MITPDRIALVVGAVLAVFLQVALAPYIAIGPAMPNFIVIFAVIAAVSRPHVFGALLPFAMGLAFDLISGGPVGAMAFSLTAFSYLVARLFASLENDTLFMPLAMMALGLFLVELAYGIFLMLFGYNAGLFEALAYRVVPCFIYDNFYTDKYECIDGKYGLANVASTVATLMGEEPLSVWEKSMVKIK